MKFLISRRTGQDTNNGPQGRVWISTTIVCAALLAIVSCTTTAQTGHDDTLHQLQVRLTASGENDVMVVAHRACWHSGPENSVSAIQACVDAGVDMVEIDVRRSRDGVLILMHDETVERTTDGSGSIGDMDYSQIASVRLRGGSGGSTAITKEAVPTLEMVLNRFRDQILINLDCKSDVYADVITMVERTGTQGQILMKMSATPTDPNLQSAPFHGRTYFMPVIRAEMGPLGDLLPGYAQYDPIAFEIVFDDLVYLEAGADAVSVAARRVWVNTMLPRYSGGLDDELATRDPAAAWGRLIGMGVNMIQTDYPIKLMAYLESQQLRQHNGLLIARTPLEPVAVH